ncbi:DUF3017 domain-containing protein [Streptomyces sp. 135]|uniref:DUF3017 domain-containing protein n=1 Tax=Streptomyces sp. 135 TaxID=2838850 RepID=UPI0021DA4F3F|nr:DUF3017 domain-containing protein [Streptomyces sp. 135]
MAKAPGAPKVTESSGASAGAEAAEASGTSEASRTAGTSGSSEAPGAAETTATPEAHGATATPETPETVQAKGAVSAPGPDGQPRKVSRRFPLFTRDTARPEGGGRAASGDAPAPARQWPLLGVASLVGLGLLLTALDVFRVGTMLVGLALVGGALLRWAVPDVGMLAVRSRFTDMVTYGALGTAIVLLAMMAQPEPWLEIPFLDDTLHFTISS